MTHTQSLNRIAYLKDCLTAAETGDNPARIELAYESLQRAKRDHYFSFGEFLS